MIVSHEHRFIFVKTRKTAGTSIEIALGGLLGSRDIATAIDEEDLPIAAEWGHPGARNISIPPQRWRARELYIRARTGRVTFFNHMPARRIRRLLPKEWQRYLTFTVVRNPYEVAVSAYAFARKWRGIAAMSLSDFISSRHFEQFSNWDVYADRERVLVDQVLRYETLDSDFRALCRDLDLPLTALPKAKAGYRSDSRGYRELLSPADRHRVAQLCREEIRHFGYRF